jgi:putative aminopeptidase FrvX
MNQTFPAVELFAELLAVPSPSAHEERLANLLTRKLESYGYSSTIDSSGNVLVHLPGAEHDAPLCILSAHMDEIGLAVTRIEPDGSLHVIRSGGLHAWKLGERQVTILGDIEDITGVVSLGAGHGASANQPVTIEQIRVYTGFSPETLARVGVRPGTPIVPVREGCGPYIFGDPQDPFVSAWTFDDRMGIVALLLMLETIKREKITPHRPMLIAFTTQEEINSSGAKSLCQREKPEVFIAVDGCPVTADCGLVVDDRPGIRSSDRPAIYDQRLLQFFCRAALQAGTSLQPVAYDISASDASMVYDMGGAQRIASLGFPRYSSHGFELAKVAVFDNLYKTLVQFVRTWQGK